MKSVAVAPRPNPQAKESGFRTHRRSTIPTLLRFEINGGLPLDSTVNGTHTLGGLLYLLGSPSSLLVGLLRVPILCPLARTTRIRLPPPLPILHMKLVLDLLPLDLGRMWNVPAINSDTRCCDENFFLTFWTFAMFGQVTYQIDFFSPQMWNGKKFKDKRKVLWISGRCSIQMGSLSRK